MTKKYFLILNKNPEQIELFSKLCQPLGSVFSSTTLENTIALLESTNFNVVLVDSAMADYSSLKGLFKKTTSIIVTGKEEKKLKEIIRSWPADRYLDYLVFPSQDQDNDGFLRTLKTATEHSQLKREVENLINSKEFTELKFQEVSTKIREIKSFLSDSLLKELEKRIALETKHFWFQREKQKIEKILRKLYTANDVSSLLDIAHDIKELVRASGITIYILEENKTVGKYLKPLVWDDAFLSHPEFSKYIALIDSQDFAAFAARYGQEINLSDLDFDRRMSKRYREHLKAPLKNILCVLIMHDKEVIGVLEVYNKIVEGEVGKEGFSKEDQQILRGLSEHISIAMTKLNLIQYDALTGVLRPDPFFDKVIQKIESQSKRRQEGGSYAIVMGDVDWFKNYNDRNGHEAGNRLLRELARVLKNTIREEDLLCRYGGEEFLFFLVGVKNIEEACALTERIRKNVEEHYFEYQEFQPKNNLTMSFGVTLFPRERVDSLSSITKNELRKIANEADMALADAKGKKYAGLKYQEKDDKALTKNKVCAYIRGQTGFIRSYREKFFEEKRKFERYYASTIIIYKENDTHKVTKTINLSLGGAKIPSETEFPPAQTLDLILILGNKASQFKGDVIYSEKGSGDVSHYYTGLRFRDLSLTDRKNLEDYFYSLEKKEVPLS
jgi:diguanylate cyclase (GGDEF)-like protein